MHQYLIKTKQPEQAIDFIMKIDEDNKSKKKDFFVKHFFIDLRMLILKPKIEKLVGKY